MQTTIDKLDTIKTLPSLSPSSLGVPKLDTVGALIEEYFGFSNRTLTDEELEKLATGKKAWKYVLIPGRHHTLTRFQARWIFEAQMGNWKDNHGETIIVDKDTVWLFAITSSNHHTTRRNPVPLQRRISQVELFGAKEDIKVLVASMHDVQTNDRFAEHVISGVHAELDVALTPENTLVAVSTPIGDQYRSLGFHTGGVELDGEPNTVRPWDLVLKIVAGDRVFFNTHAHPVCHDLWSRYDLFTHVKRVFEDQVVSSDDGALTDTRHYATYAQAFEDSAHRKWEQVKDWVTPGRIVDVGCATGELFVEAGKDPRLAQSDFIGIEPDRWLFTEAEHRAELGVFANPNTFFYRRNILDGQTFLAESVDTTITMALTHEIYSYGNGESDLLKLIKIISEHTRSGGTWINLDLCAPEDADRIVRLELSRNDGEAMPILEDIEKLPSEQIAKYLGTSSTDSRFRQFAHDWPRFYKRTFYYEEVEPGMYELSLKNAMEFMLHKDYADNWASELHESFTFQDFDFWRRELKKAGFTLLDGSGSYTNDWIATNRFDSCARLWSEHNEPMDWPTTHMGFAARKV